MSIFEDLEPSAGQPKKPKDLSGLSIGELADYIARLQSEIQRAEETIAAKRRAAEGAASVFKR